METVNVLSGCGGGYDVFGALPMYFRLSREGKKCVLLNFSFTEAYVLRNAAKKLGKYLYRVDPDEKHQGYHYFPEGYLANELQVSIYIIPCWDITITCKDVQHCYEIIQQLYKVETIYLVDGGCDAILKGNEEDLGTPAEDMMHIKGIEKIQCAKFITAIGLCVDAHGETMIKQLAQRLLELKAHEQTLVWTKENADVARYITTFRKHKPVQSVVHSLVVAAIDGERGMITPSHLRAKIGKSRVVLSELTCTQHTYPYDVIVSTNLYFHRLKDTMTLAEIDDEVVRFRLEQIN